MYSDELKEKNESIEINIHPVSKWRRILLYLGDMLIVYILSFAILNIAVAPIASAFVNTNSAKAYEAEKNRDDILYENKLLFYKDDTDYKKYEYDQNLKYTYNRFLAFYVFSDESSLNPDYPEYSHLPENEVIYTYYHTIRNDDITYYDLFSKLNKEKNYFEVTTSSVSLKQAIIDELQVYYKPGESLGKKGQEYYDNLSEIFAALYGVVTQDIYEKDLKDSAGHSFIECQRIIAQVSADYYRTLAICSMIAYIISALLVHLLYPMINKSGHTPTSSIMKMDRLDFVHLQPLSKAEVALSSAYSIVLDLPCVMFIPLSYTTFIYSLRIPALPILSIISFVVVLASMFVILFNNFNRSGIDLLSRTVMVPTEEVDSIIKAKETIKELELAELRKKREENGQGSTGSSRDK